VFQDRPAGSQAYMNALKPILLFYVPLFLNYIRNMASQLQCLSALEDDLASKEDLAPCIGRILHILYENEVLSEEAITNWFEDLEAGSVIRKQASFFFLKFNLTLKLLNIYLFSGGSFCKLAARSRRRI
jgi:eIF4-gamma/eIF5/eIF2-epsilon